MEFPGGGSGWWYGGSEWFRGWFPPVHPPVLTGIRRSRWVQRVVIIKGVIREVV